MSMKKKVKKKRDDKSKPVVMLAWTFHPFRSNIKLGFGVIFLALLFCTAVYWNVKDIYLSILSLIILIFSLSSFFFPTYYTLEEDGIRVKTLMTANKYPWSSFRKYIQKGKAIHLSPFIKSNFMESYRSISLFCDDIVLPDVLEVVREKLS